MENLRLVTFDPIITNLNILNEQYQNYLDFRNQRFNFFVFPNENSFNDIRTRAGELNELLNRQYISDNDIKNSYITLSDLLDAFLKKIKKSSFENDIFSIIRGAVEELNNFRNRVDSIMDRINDENESINIQEEAEDMFQRENNNSMIFYGESLDNINNRNNININGITDINSYEEDDIMDEKFVKNIEIDEISDDPNVQKYLKIINDFTNFKNKGYNDNFLVKNQIFNDVNPEFIKNNFAEYDLLLDFKTIQNEFIKQCKIEKEKLNFEYNFIIPDLNLNEKKGGEKYYPPHGWFGIGVKNPYKFKIKEDIPKATAYYGFDNLSFKKIKIMLYIIMHKGFYINPDLQPKCRFNDKRRPGKFVGTGIYLTPKINIIEKNTGIVHFNKKAYKIALMVNVLSHKIRQPDNNYWILQPNEIEITRIIFKEIYFD